MGKSTSTQTATLTPEQRAQIQAQTQLLTETLIPAYKETISGAKEARDLTSELATGAYGNASVSQEISKNNLVNKALRHSTRVSRGSLVYPQHKAKRHSTNKVLVPMHLPIYSLTNTSRVNWMLPFNL